MKKNGFTLAETLITLGVVGLLAAISLPSFVTNSASLQIGPRLAKAVAVFEQANEALLNEYKVDSLAETGLLDAANPERTVGNALSRHMKLSAIDSDDYSISDPSNGTCRSGESEYDRGGELFISGGGVLYRIQDYGSIVLGDPQRLRRGRVVVDINGESGPNEVGTDVFVFYWYNDGTLKPFGSGALNFYGYTDCHWTRRCPIGEIPSAYASCAGHIFENNLKVLYK